MGGAGPFGWVREGRGNEGDGERKGKETNITRSSLHSLEIGEDERKVVGWDLVKANNAKLGQLGRGEMGKEEGRKGVRNGLQIRCRYA